MAANKKGGNTSMASATKVTISVEPKLLERIDNYADENGMTRSGFISLAVKKYLEAEAAMPSITKMMAKLAEMVGDKTGMSDEEKLEQLNILEDNADRILGRK